MSDQPLPDKALSLSQLPYDILALLPGFLHTIEDYINLASTCRIIRKATARVSPGSVLRLVAAQSRIFFRPSPHFLVAAIARDLGTWARASDANEQEFAQACQEGLDGVLDLALLHCGLTFERIYELHQLRFTVVNPITNIIDQCIGTQWYSTPNFWDGGVDDAYTIDSDPPATFFHLAIYGEIFGPEIESVIDPSLDVRRLSIATRFEFMKYCIPDYRIRPNTWNVAGPQTDSRLIVKETGPYAISLDSRDIHDNSTALVWVLQSSRWHPHWDALINKLGQDFRHGTVTAVDAFNGDAEPFEMPWRQRLFLHLLWCQGLKGLEMILPERHEEWLPQLITWKQQIQNLSQEPEHHIIESDQRKLRIEGWPCLLVDMLFMRYRMVAARTRLTPPPRSEHLSVGDLFG